MKILLIGSGKMGGAMLKGWSASEAVSGVDVVSPHAKDNPSLTKVTAFSAIEEWAAQNRKIDIAVLAVKPAMFADVCPALKPHLPNGLPVLSVAAGITIEQLGDLLGEDHPYIRTMPNTPSSIGEGVTGYALSDKVSSEQCDMAVSLLSALGTAVRIDESMMDALTAISGCGPAYFYYFVECIEKAGKTLGLPDDVATQLARETFMGAAALMQATGHSSEELRLEVAGPTTETATGTGILQFQENRSLENLVESAISAACTRARMLGKIQ